MLNTSVLICFRVKKLFIFKKPLFIGQTLKLKLNLNLKTTK